MEQENRSVYATGPAPPKDWFLQFLVNLANKNRLEFDVTLAVGGLMVSGTLIGVRAYFDALGDYFARPGLFSGKVDEVRETFKKIGDQCSCVAPSEKTETPSYIHLKNVRFFDGSASPPEGRFLSWWRGRLSEVDGFSPGRAEEQTPRQAPRKL